MKINRFRSGLFLAACIASSLLIVPFSTNGLYNSESLPNVVKIYSPLNDASLLALSYAMITASLLSLIVFITGRCLRWLPKAVVLVLSCLFLASFAYGWHTNVSTKQELNEKGYIECVSERELALKFSSKTYVLPPETCD
ncbi:hypothetical protein ACS83_13010 [Vibrio alginolyticus]|nr:hypothetical protein [Vibrio alginolyticus]KOE02053.1 hypothetical protein ACS83_13010 [Vibrio alginolyticus]